MSSADEQGLPRAPVLVPSPLSLYVHFPWCVRKCPYCDFNSHTLHGTLPEQAYVQALLRDLERQLDEVQQREIVSVFLGGGTPSLFSPHAIAELLTALAARVRLASDAEITLEANPGTVERGRFDGYRAAGVTRVSLGAQSFDDEALRRLGRIHAAAETRIAVAELRAAGIENFNLDLMYALPHQSIEAAVADVEAAMQLEPTHLSHYELTLEPGTVFGGRPPSGLPDSDRAMQMQLACQARLAEQGYQQYEVSAYARPTRRCRHNLNYWSFGDYLGVGAGAHGKCSRLHGSVLQIERTWHEREPRRYLAAEPPVAQRRPVRSTELPFEYAMNALRLRAGFDEAHFEQSTGLSRKVLQPGLERLCRRGLLEAADSGAGHWRASTRGFELLNEVISEFLVAGPEVAVGSR